MTFGLKLALYFDEMNRNLTRLEMARGTVSGELFTGQWVNVGSADDLAHLNGTHNF